MRRRDVITALAGAAALPFAARSQAMPVIGFLGTSSPASWRNTVAAFQQRLRELGWIEGRTIAIEYRWAEGREERYTEIAAEFVRLKVDVIVTSGAAVDAAKQATSSIPIVFAVANNPLGLVASLARPGGNVTGLSGQQPDLVGKRFEMLREIIPAARRVAIMGNAAYAAAAEEMREAEAAARAASFDTVRVEIRQLKDIANGFDTIKGRADALYLCADPLAIAERFRINTFAQAQRLPTIYNAKEYVEAGGLMSYGPNLAERFRRAADHVDKILRGTKPGDIPVEQPTKFELVINLIVAKALGLTVPPSLLARADEVIE